MKHLWLIKIGEIALKKGNTGYFEHILKENIKRSFTEIDVRCSISILKGRYYLETEHNPQIVDEILRGISGIVAISRAERVRKTLDELFKASLKVARECLNKSIGNRFKFEVRRSDKSLPLDSYGYARELGRMLLEALPELKVDVHEPDFIIHVELREWGYVYQHLIPGPGGLPVGSIGRAMLLLSGGIDSPVAACLMAKRGLKITAIHFHTAPYTSEEAHDKVVRLAKLIAPYCGGISLISVPFTDCQMLISRQSEASSLVLHSRACMMQIAERWASKKQCHALITGESLGQVASQTLESIAFTNSTVDLPVFRPLIGMDKEEIISIARQKGTFETSIEPFEDCCTLFSPERPKTRPDRLKQLSQYDAIEGLDELIDEAVYRSEIIRIDSHGRLSTDLS